jgi:2'-5' RNA ligase
LRLRSHWAREFQSGRYWLATFDHQLDFLASWLEPILDRPYLSPVPPEWLHLTLAAASDDDVRDRLASIATVDALVGPVRVVDEGIVAGMEPEYELQALFEAAGGRGTFWPHVAFAYARAEAEVEQLEANASDAVLIDTVSLVDLRREGQQYRWDVVETVRLASPA